MFGALEGIEVYKSLGFYILVAVARPFGFLLVFAVFNFALPNARIIKIAIALGFGAPVAIAYEVPLFDVYTDGRFFDRVFLPFKELILGLLIGFFASLPFYGFKFAGSLIDNYRGESSNGLRIDGGDTTTTLGLLFYLALLYAFLTNDGMWRLIEVVYTSYTIWPIETYLPPISTAAIGVAINHVIDVFFIMVQVGLPLLLLLFLCEMFVVLSVTFGQRFGFGNSIFLTKNLACLAILPIYFIYLTHVSDTYVPQVWMPLQVIEGIIK
ncbi:MAG: flagellar biosynthetic protein FliR [Pseudomonadota bacterium]